MDPFLLAFIVIVLVGSVTVYGYYLKEKKAQLNAVLRGVCPRCKQKTVVVTDRRSHGCSGTETIHIVCESCGFENSFTVPTGGCGSGRCAL